MTNTNKPNTRTQSVVRYEFNIFCNIKSDPTRISYCAKVSLFPISWAEATERPTKPSLSDRRKQNQYFTQKIETIRMRRRSSILRHIYFSEIYQRTTANTQFVEMNISIWTLEIASAHVRCFLLLLFISVLYVLFLCATLFFLSLARSVASFLLCLFNQQQNLW